MSDSDPFTGLSLSDRARFALATRDEERRAHIINVAETTMFERFSDVVGEVVEVDVKDERVTFVTDGLNFRAKVINYGMETEDCLLEMKRAGTWTTVRDLADVGEVIRYNEEREAKV